MGWYSPPNRSFQPLRYKRDQTASFATSKHLPLDYTVSRRREDFFPWSQVCDFLSFFTPPSSFLFRMLLHILAMVLFKNKLILFIYLHFHDVIHFSSNRIILSCRFNFLLTRRKGEEKECLSQKNVNGRKMH